jgi:hypothetical protein
VQITTKAKLFVAEAPFSKEKLIPPERKIVGRGLVLVVLRMVVDSAAVTSDRVARPF